MQESLEELQARIVSDLGGGPHLQGPERVLRIDHE